MPKPNVEGATHLLFDKLVEAIDDCIAEQSPESALKAATTWLRPLYFRHTDSGRYHTYRFVDELGGTIELLYRVKHANLSQANKTLIHEFDVTLIRDGNTVEYRSWRA